ncbi:hypothetical protein [Desulfocurvus sp. DL9XJH121]
MTISSVDTSTMSLQDIKDLMQDSGVTSMDLLSELGGDDASMEDMLLQEFDADGDGELSEEEAAALQEKLESMRDFMAQMLEQMMENATGDSGETAVEVSSDDATGVSGGEESSTSGSLSSAIEDALTSDSTDEADANGDGVVTDEELAEFLGVDVADLGSVLNAAAQPSDSGETDSGSDFAKDLIAQAIQAYLQNADDTASEGAMSLGGTSDGVNAIA